MRTRDIDRNDDADLVIGLVNNMPKAAHRTTECQFQSLLDLASRRRGVRARLFLMPGCQVQTGDRTDGTSYKEDLDLLRNNRIDGMIVTGSEPRAAEITDEPIWPALSRLVDWADEHTTSTVWSCLAAHAAVYHMDGLSRQPLPGKLSGVFECTKASDHYLVADSPARWSVPHSRVNGLDEDALSRNGYQILSRAPRIGADTAVKKKKSLFVVLQGHPEYGPESLLREYRRDIRRFLTGERSSYPEMPEQYFDSKTMAALTVLRESASRQPDPALLAVFDAAVTAPPAPSWGEPAVSFYARWLSYLVEHKPACQARSGRVH
jgi:homoserine O-succinyltransferase